MKHPNPTNFKNLDRAELQRLAKLANDKIAVTGGHRLGALFEQGSERAKEMGRRAGKASAAARAAKKREKGS